MRAPAVLLNVVIACALGGFSGYTIAQRKSAQEVTKLRQEHRATLIHEQELRTQLESALTARAALEHESQRLQTELSERLRRLEDLAAKLNPPPQPSDTDTTIGDQPEQESGASPQ
jgi:uncharacterized protein HemX